MRCSGGNQDFPGGGFARLGQGAGRETRDDAMIFPMRMEDKLSDKRQ